MEISLIMICLKMSRLPLVARHDRFCWSLDMTDSAGRLTWQCKMTVCHFHFWGSCLLGLGFGWKRRGCGGAMFYEAARSEIWFARSPRSAITPADHSKRATQLSPGAALPALCLLVSGRFGDPVHRMPVLVYGAGWK